ncbi:methylase involved in ubiquinone/menaquinone biosynthesis [Leptothrix ochracea L12]|uniref:Methylase involved in ubiquinone/menaquinone biosynthesis n=1 Tax=Leptothrix ochracea L12 TaxID=735332 RepID=I4Z5T6_9BURK|nr:methyltransferase domain-containing protein [Leptothrix ochracea]EIM31578.1 methylase involved in ubiquinone/menaquinone biosynthesis [Leptothrix ochracea L12]
MTKVAPIIGNDPLLPLGFQTPQGRYLLAWEQQLLNGWVADVFGFHAVQLGWPALESLRMNRMPHRWRVDHEGSPERADAALRADFSALPFPSASLDLIVMPHTLEQAQDPHRTLREAERVLVADGRLMLVGFNPVGLWAWQRQPIHEGAATARSVWIGHRRARDWLHLLGFEILQEQFGVYRPPLRHAVWLERCAWMDRVGPLAWPMLSAVYAIEAVKRIQGVHLIRPRRATPLRPMPAAAATTPRQSHPEPH